VNALAAIAPTALAEHALLAGDPATPPVAVVPESSLQAQLWAEARRVYGLGIARLAFRTGQSADDYAEWLANMSDVGDARVRTHLYQLAHAEWVQLIARQAAGDVTAEPVDILQYQDVRRAGEIWITRKVYVHQEAIRHAYPPDAPAYAEGLARTGFTVRWYGADWFRAWPGRHLTPVRTAEGVRRARQEITNGTFYIPADYHVPAEQIDLAFDL